MFCSKCGTQLNEGSAFCPRCGASVASVAEKTAADVSSKSRLATSLLSWFLGGFGAHRFYVGKAGTAVVMLVMGVLSGVCWLAGLFGPLAVDGDEPIWGLMLLAGVLYFAVSVWKIIDFIMAVTGKFKDSRGKVIQKW